MSVITNKRKVEGFDVFLRDAIKEGVFSFVDMNSGSDMSEK